MKHKRFTDVGELQDAILLAYAAFDAVHKIFDTAVNLYPKAHNITKGILRSWDSTQRLYNALESELERMVSAGAVCKSDNWWMVHPSFRPDDHKWQERPRANE